MQTTKLIQQLASDSAVYGLSGVVDKLVAVLLIPVYTRVFTRAEVGVLSLVDVTVTLAATVAVLGLDNASARWFYDSSDESDRRATVASSFWCQLAASILLATALIASSPWLAEWLTGTAEQAGLVWLAAMGLPSLVVLRTWSMWLRYQRRAWSILVLTAVRGLGRAGLIFWLVLVFHYGLTGVYLGRLVNMTVLAIVGTAALWPWLHPDRFRLGRLKAMLRFGLPLAPAALGVWIMTSADRFLLGILCDRSEVGLYDMAAKLSSVIALGTVAFQQAWGPFAYSIMHNKGARAVYAKVLDVYCLVGCALATAVALFGPLLFRVMTTEPFYVAASCLPPLAFAYFFVGAQFIAGLGSGIAKRSMPLATSIWLGAAVNLGANFVLIPLWGRDGAAWATLLAYALSTAFLFAIGQRHHPIPYRWTVPLGCLATSAGLVLAAGAWVPELGLAGLAVAAAMLVAFVPLGYWLAGIRWAHLRPGGGSHETPQP